MPTQPQARPALQPSKNGGSVSGYHELMTSLTAQWSQLLSGGQAAELYFHTSPTASRTDYSAAPRLYGSAAPVIKVRPRAHRCAFRPLPCAAPRRVLEVTGGRIFSEQRTQILGHHRSGRCDGRSGGMRCDWPERSAGRGPAAQRCRRPGAGAAGRNRLVRDGSASWCHLRRHGRRAHCPATGLAALGQPHSMGERQARHLLAPARSHIRLAPSYLPGHGAPARYPDAQRPAVLPEDGLPLRQSPGYREVPAILVLCPAGWVGAKLEPDQARNGRRTQRAEHGGWADLTAQEPNI
jgi:hypothetical protein